MSHTLPIVVFISLALFLITYVVITTLMIVESCRDYRNDKKELVKARADKNKIMIKTYESNLKASREDAVFAPMIGVIFTLLIIVLGIMWCFLKVKALFKRPKTI